MERLTSIREAVALQTKELERLHKIDIAATAIDHLVLDYQSQKQTLEAKYLLNERHGRQKNCSGPASRRNTRGP